MHFMALASEFQPFPELVLTVRRCGLPRGALSSEREEQHSGWLLWPHLLSLSVLPRMGNEHMAVLGTDSAMSKHMSLAGI